MKKIILSALLAISMQAAFAQGKTDNSNMPNPSGSNPNVNQATDLKQNGNAWNYSTQTKAEVTTVPVSVSNSFKKSYPNQQDVTWYQDKNGYMASYHGADGMEQQVMYDANGRMTSTSIEIKAERLPAAATAYLEKNYEGKTYDHIYVISPPTGARSYIVSVDGKWIAFDSKGNYVPSR